MGGGTYEIEEKPLGDISGLWRSEDMELRTMSIERSVLEQAVRRFGDISCVQFRDMNGSGGEEGESKIAGKNRHFVTQVRTCESVERCLRYFDEQISLFEIKGDMNNTYEAPLGIEEFRGVANYNDLPNALEILNTRLIADEENLRDQVDKLTKYKSEVRTEYQRYSSLSWASTWVSSERDADDYTRRQETSGLLGEDGTALLVVGSSAQSLGQLVGVIATDKKDVFNRMLYRVTKGNAVATLHDLDNGITCFRILYSSFEMQARILKLTAANNASVFLGRVLIGASGQSDPRASGINMLPDSKQSCTELLEKIKKDCDERNALIISTETAVKTQLISVQKVHKDRRHYAIREKSLYHTLNMMQIDEGTCFANAIAWIPTRQLDKVSNVLAQFPLCRLNEDDLKDADPESPPTYFETNEFIGTFQGIVDSYGVPRYHEVNPTIFTVVTFPWLFGIMYGDIGHGVFITIAAALMIFFQEPMKKMKLNEMVDMVFGARWLLLLMGLFAVYQGFLYNDTFGIMLDYSGTRYKWPDGWSRPEEWSEKSCFDNATVPAVCVPCHISDMKWKNVTYQGLTYERCTCSPDVQYDLTEATKYSCPSWSKNNSPNLMTPSEGPIAFGIDSGWSEATNKLTFYNSYKMKNAVIVGVLQMTLGLFLSLCNHLYFKDYKHLFFGFIPECMFLFCTFGYMCVMLIAKWVTPWENTNLAPNSLETMTNFFLSPGKYTEFKPEECIHNSSGSFNCDGVCFFFNFYLCGSLCTKASYLVLFGSVGNHVTYVQ